MMDSKQLAALIGPTLIALAVTEAANIDVFANQIAPVVFLNGAVLFVVGLALVRAHNIWALRWPLIVTVIGWGGLILGLWRMAMPEAPQLAGNVSTYAILAVMGTCGAILSHKAYGSE